MFLSVKKKIDLMDRRKCISESIYILYLENPVVARCHLSRRGDHRLSDGFTIANHTFQTVVDDRRSFRRGSDSHRRREEFSFSVFPLFPLFFALCV